MKNVVRYRFATACKGKKTPTKIQCRYKLKVFTIFSICIFSLILAGMWANQNQKYFTHQMHSAIGTEYELCMVGSVCVTVFFVTSKQKLHMF